MNVFKFMCHLQVSDVKWLLVDVGGVRSSSQAPHTGQVATVTSHGLDDEHASLGPTGRLLDAVAGLTHAYIHTLTVLVHVKLLL